ncbi:MAG TPA: hypothetical protein VGM13_12735 [Thermoanaerobaculia bacterium]|jgi:hypothetical protein
MTYTDDPVGWTDGPPPGFKPALGAVVPPFCDACIAATSTESPGSTRRVNGIGTALWEDSSPCPSCGSIEVRMWFTFLFVPLIPLGRYKVIYLASRASLLHDKRYVGRKVKAT